MLCANNFGRRRETAFVVFNADMQNNSVQLSHTIQAENAKSVK